MPAMAAKITDTLHDMDWIVGLIDARAPKPGPRGPYRKRQQAVPSIYSSASPWVGSQPCGAKYPGFCADSKGV